MREFPRKKEVKICELLLTNLSGFLDLLIEVGALSSPINCVKEQKTKSFFYKLILPRGLQEL